jgi:hypothetical protein
LNHFKTRRARTGSVVISQSVVPPAAVSRDREASPCDRLHERLIRVVFFSNLVAMRGRRRTYRRPRTTLLWPRAASSGPPRTGTPIESPSTRPRCPCCPWPARSTDALMIMKTTSSSTSTSTLSQRLHRLCGSIMHTNVRHSITLPQALRQQLFEGVEVVDEPRLLVLAQATVLVRF